MKKVFLDIETTGLIPEKHGIIQIAMLMDIDGEVMDEMLIDVQPFSQDMICLPDGQEELFWSRKQFTEIYPDDLTTALQPSGILIKDIVDFDLPLEGHQKIVEFLDKHIDRYDKVDKAYLGGYNVNFDRGFITAFFKKCDDPYLGSYLNWKCLDPLYMLWQMDCDGEIELENYKLETVCAHFGITLYAHNAISDIKATRELYYLLKKGALAGGAIK